jgi:LysR family transcriptional activator of nhaA
MNLKHLFYFWKVATTGSVVRASEELHLTPQTVSGQVQMLERHLGKELFARRGRRLELTEDGQFVLGYAKEIFALQAELEGMVRQERGSRPGAFRIGVADAVPKTLAYRLLEPALQLPNPHRVVCTEWRLDSLLSELAVHRLDLVIADLPLPDTAEVRAFSHRLGESPVSFLAAPSLARRCRRQPFPACLDGTPMLLPGSDSAMRAKLMRWFDRHKLQPDFVGEFDGSSLMTAFGETGFGVFAAPSVLEDELHERHGVVQIAATREIMAEYFAISVERRLTHPCVQAITQAARDRILKPAATAANVRH